jgi:heme-degrading monooxygenase HmoA
VDEQRTGFQLPDDAIAVIFVSQKGAQHDHEYGQTSQRMIELAKQCDGFVGIESVRDESGAGITISYWRDLPSIQAWKQHPEHLVAQLRGKNEWYNQYQVQVCRLLYQYGKSKEC